MNDARNNNRSAPRRRALAAVRARNPVVVLEHRDGEWRVADVNRAYETRSGRRRRELVGDAWRAIPAQLALQIRIDAEHRRLEHIAFHDELTGLANRRLLARRLDSAIAAARADAREFAVLFIDLDGFKDVNDSLG